MDEPVKVFVSSIDDNVTREVIEGEYRLRNYQTDRVPGIIMAKKVTPETAIAVLKVTIALCFSWPLPKKTSTFQVICFRILHFFFSVNVIVLIVPTVYTLSCNDGDLTKLIKLWCLLGAFVQVIVESIQFALQHQRLQYLIAEMEHNFKHAEAYERDIYQRYTNRCAAFHGGLTLAVFLTALGASLITPLTTVNQTLPIETKYPFDVKYEPVRSLLFLHHFLVLWQCFSTVCLSNFIALLIWFVAARFEILSRRYRAVNNIRDIVACIQQHTTLLRYAQEIITTVRPVLLVIIIICTWAILASALTIISRSTLADKAQFLVLCISGLMEVYACAWPADHLIDASSNVAQATYESSWYNQDVTVQKNVRFILLKSQTPTIVSISSILPVLSLNYYASYISTAFSYLMTLRMVFVK